MIPEQQRAIANYVRIHALFTLGPQAIKERMEAEKDEWQVDDFDKKLETFRERLINHIGESHNEISKIFEQELKPHVGPIHDQFLFPQQSHSYEIWLSGFVHQFNFEQRNR